MRIAAGAGAILLALTGAAGAQQLDLGGLGQMSGSTVGTIIQLFGVITVLSVAPGLLIKVPSFTRFIIAYSILRAGIGLQSTPANLILISLSLFMTFYVMAPTFDRAWTEGVQPLMDNRIEQSEAVEKIADPFRTFMLDNVREKDFDLFADLARERGQTVSREEVDLRILVPAFMISEIRRGFEIGVAAVQDHVLRADRRLEPAGGLAGAVLRLKARKLSFYRPLTMLLMLLEATFRHSSGNGG